MTCGGSKRTRPAFPGSGVRHTEAPSSEGNAIVGSVPRCLGVTYSVARRRRQAGCPGSVTLANLPSRFSASSFSDRSIRALVIARCKTSIVRFPELSACPTGMSSVGRLARSDEVWIRGRVPPTIPRKVICRQVDSVCCSGGCQYRCITFITRVGGPVANSTAAWRTASFSRATRLRLVLRLSEQTAACGSLTKLSSDSDNQ